MLLPLPLADAFADAAEQEEDNSGVDYVHIRVQQRNGKKSLTTVQVSWPRCCCRAVRAHPSRPCRLTGCLVCCVPQGLKKSYDYKKVLKALKKGGCAWAASDSVWDPSLSAYCMRAECCLLACPTLLPFLTQSSAATALSWMTLS